MIAVHGREYPRTLRLGIIDVVVPGLKDEHREVWLLREARRERQAGCTTANDSDTPFFQSSSVFTREYRT